MDFNSLVNIFKVSVSVVTSAYPVEEVSGSRPGRVILKTLKIAPTVDLFGVEHVRVKVGAVITFSRHNLQGMG
jgi:hypothetical protein